MECKKAKFKIYENMDRGLCRFACGRQDKQLNTYDWLADVPGNTDSTDLVEVQFKHTRKGYFHNVNNLDLHKGDIVAVEANPGHDIGVVTLTGRLVLLQIKKANLRSEDDILRIYRIASESDMDKYREAKSREHGTMIQSREIAKSLGLEMKIGDVEYQGDGNKAIFYYIADERVDFRKLIKVLAETFHVRIEMKQIGARQEAGRIGGTGPCGRELCCATWMNNFVSVSTNAARFQDISLNPQKLAGMCAKLKCCLNYEVDTYIEAGRKIPSREIVLQTLDADYFQFKSDILAGEVTYSTEKGIPANLVTIPAERAIEVIKMNKRGEKPENLVDGEPHETENSSKDLLENESITRFDKSKKKRKAKPVRQRPNQQQTEVHNPTDNEQPANTTEGVKNEQPAEGQNQNEKPNQNQEGRPQRERRPNRREDGDRPRQQNRRDNGDKTRPQNHREDGDNKPRHQNHREENGERPRQQNRRDNGDRPNRREEGDRPRQQNRRENNDKPHQQNRKENADKQGQPNQKGNVEAPREQNQRGNEDKPHQQDTKPHNFHHDNNGNGENVEKKNENKEIKDNSENK